MDSDETVEGTLFTEDELHRLLSNFLSGTPDGTADEEELATVIGWANAARLQNTLLEAALEGKVGLRIAKGQMQFKRLGEC